MPSTATITAFYSFSAKTLIQSAQHNTNFGAFRGHIIPIDPNTSTAAATGTYDLGSTEYSWRNVYANNIVLATAASSVTNWNKYSISYTNLQGATATNFSELFISPAKGTIEKIAINHSAAFTGGLLSGVSLKVGILGEQDRYVSEFDAFNTSTTQNVFSLFDVPSFSTVTSIRLYATASGSTLDSLAAGTIDIYVLRGALE